MRAAYPPARTVIAHGHPAAARQMILCGASGAGRGAQQVGWAPPAGVQYIEPPWNIWYRPPPPGVSVSSDTG
ncbi:hypothetical protein Ate01nite_34920 [Actinoplanes teichomyceticus]|nr:hypothetical protein Ate01nite_34920 [Actinoplanes teichomyceticus]